MYVCIYLSIYLSWYLSIYLSSHRPLCVHKLATKCKQIPRSLENMNQKDEVNSLHPFWCYLCWFPWHVCSFVVVLFLLPLQCCLFWEIVYIKGMAVCMYIYIHIYIYAGGFSCRVGYFLTQAFLALLKPVFLWGPGPFFRKKAVSMRKKDVKIRVPETDYFKKKRLGLQSRESDPTRHAKPRTLGLQNREGAFQQKAHICERTTFARSKEEKMPDKML